MSSLYFSNAAHAQPLYFELYQNDTLLVGKKHLVLNMFTKNLLH